MANGGSADDGRRAKVMSASQILGPGLDAVNRTGNALIARTANNVVNSNDSTRCVSADGLWQFVRHVPDVMRRQSPPWDVAARLQEAWLSGRANTLDTATRSGSTGPIGVQRVTMEWVLRFERAKDLFGDVIEPTAFANEAVRQVLRQRIDPALTEESPMFEFGNISGRDQQLDSEVRSCDSIGLLDYAGQLFSGLDELTAALARFSMCAIPKGVARLKANEVTVEIRELGVYCTDVYDFSRWQPLGFWKLPNRVTALKLDAISNVSPSIFSASPEFCFDRDWIPVENAIYRRYRRETGLGTDFFVYSDVRRVTLAQPHSFVYSRGE